MDTPLDAALKFRKAAAKVDKANDQKVALAAKYVDLTIRAGNPDSLRNARKRGNGATRGTAVKLGVFVSRGPSGPGDSRLIAGRGPWHLLEFDTSAHLIGLGRRKETFGKAIGSSRRGYMRFADGQVRLGPIAHPGTHGKHGFRHAWEAAAPEVPRIIDGELKKDFLIVFGT